MRISDWSSDVCSSDLHVDALARQRVGAAIAVVLRNGEAIFLVLQLLEEFQAALARNPRLAEITRPGKVGGAFLRPRKGQALAHRRLLPHAEIGRESGRDRECQ